MRGIGSASGVTLMELTVALAMMFVVGTLGGTQAASLLAQMKATRDARDLASQMSALRGEARRRKTSVTVRFQAGGIAWDFDSDGTVDGTLALSKGSSWYGGPPTALRFNGLGLARGVTATQSITIANGKWRPTFTIGANGHISF